MLGCLKHVPPEQPDLEVRVGRLAHRAGRGDAAQRVARDDPQLGGCARTGLRVAKVRIRHRRAVRRDRRERLEAQEKEVLRRTHSEANGNLTRGAEMFGVPRTTYREKLMRHGLLDT